MAIEDIDKYKFNKRTPEEQQEIARMGGIASGEARRRKKTLKEQFDLLLSLPVKIDGKTGKKIKEVADDLGIPVEELDNQMAMCLNMYVASMSKKPEQAFASIQATIGEKPVEEIKVTKSTDDTIKEIDDYLCKKKN